MMSVFYQLTKNWKRDFGQLEGAVGGDVWKVLKNFAPDADGFFWDSVVDVLLYRFVSNVFRPVRAHVLHDMARVIQKHLDDQGHTDTNFSVMAHSLGTAVVNDALHYLGTAEIADREVFEAKNFMFHRYFAVANVSGVLWREKASLYDTTTLRPPFGTAKGVVREMLNVRHVADPFPAPCQFAPGWASPAYRDVSIDHVHQANVHDWLHYLEHPDVMGCVLQSLFPDVDDDDLRELRSGFLPYIPQANEAAFSAAVNSAKARYRKNFAGTDRVLGPFIKTTFQLAWELRTVVEDLIAAGATS
jgi:hypothetical protein